MNVMQKPNGEKSNSFFLILILALMLVASGRSPSFAEVGFTKQNIYKPTGSEATITGSVSFIGTPPKPKRGNMSQDSHCAAVNPDAFVGDVLISNGMLANVIVYIKSGGDLEKFYFGPPSSPVIIDRQLCQYAPRVVAIQSGQMLRVLNSDLTAHNFHPNPRKNVEWNRSQAIGAEPFEQSFKYPEIIVVKCNRHPWMRAFVGVFDHPYFFVTADDGSFKIEGLSPGRYTLAAWHEVFGEQTLELIITPNESKTVPFIFGR
jgi:hypothetical protein